MITYQFSRHLILRSILFLVGVLALSACAVQQPKVQVEGITGATFLHNHATVDVDLRVQNPNDFSIPIQSGMVNILLNGEPAGSGSLTQSVTLPSHASTDVVLPVVLSIPVLKSQILPTLLAKGLQYQLNGSLAIHGMSHPYQINHSGFVGLSVVKNLFQDL